MTASQRRVIEAKEELDYFSLQLQPQRFSGSDILRHISPDDTNESRARNAQWVKDTVNKIKAKVNKSRLRTV